MRTLISQRRLLISLLILVVALLQLRTAYSSPSGSAFLEVCDGFDSQLQVGDTAIVITTPALNMRPEPSTSSEPIIIRIPTDDSVELLDGPVCADGYTWWNATYDNQDGWVAEGNPDRYLLAKEGAETTTASLGSQANVGSALLPLEMGLGAGERFETCAGGNNDGVYGRVMFSEDAIGPGGRVAVVLTTQVLEADLPAICIDDSMGFNGNAAAISPTGQQIQPYIIRADNRRTQVQLPLHALSQPGLWTLTASNYEIGIDVQRPRHPYIVATMANGGQFLIGGLRPNERFVALGRTRSDEIPMWMQAQADNDGNYVASLDQLEWLDSLEINRLVRSIYTTDIIGNMGSVWSYEGAAVHGQSGERLYTIPLEQSAALIAEIVWGGYDQSRATNLLAGFTCPGASSIRLAQNQDATVLGDAGQQSLYEDPSFSSPQRGVVNPGERISIEDGIVCADNAVWWYASTRSEQGWITESRGNQYQLIRQ